MMKPTTRADYPLSETQGSRICGPRGVPLEDITLEAVTNGTVEIEDLRISRDALLAQADIARDAGRATLAANFERGAELIDVPQEVIMQTYEMLRPGRVATKAALAAQAALLRNDYNATKVADFIDRAAEIYLRRGLLDE